MQQLDFLKQFAAERGLCFCPDTPASGVSDVSIYSPDMRYRYAFARWGADQGPLDRGSGSTQGSATPSSVGDRRSTPHHLVAYVGVGRVDFPKLFAARTKGTAELRDDPNPTDLTDLIGPHNDAALAALSQVAARTIVAWGNRGLLQGRAAKVAPLIVTQSTLAVWGSQRQGQPRHPLYVKAD